MSNLPIKLGQFIPVENKNKKNLENNTYIAVQVEDVYGNNERCILFTEAELSDATNINSLNWFVKHMTPGRIYPTIIRKTIILFSKNV